ncbi:hypothetical protein MASR1M8_06220 [Thermomonas brevis]
MVEGVIGVGKALQSPLRGTSPAGGGRGIPLAIATPSLQHFPRRRGKGKSGAGEGETRRFAPSLSPQAKGRVGEGCSCTSLPRRRESSACLVRETLHAFPRLREGRRCAGMTVANTPHPVIAATTAPV